MWWLTFKYLSALSPPGLQDLPLPTLSLSTLHSLTLVSTIRKRQGLFIRLPHPKLAKEHFPGMQPLLPWRGKSKVNPPGKITRRTRWTPQFLHLTGGGLSTTYTWCREQKQTGTCPSLWLWTMNRIVHHFVGSARRSAAAIYLSTTSKITSAARTFHQPNTIVSSRQ